jgi:hypothetical protein
MPIASNVKCNHDVVRQPAPSLRLASLIGVRIAAGRAHLVSFCATPLLQPWTGSATEVAAHTREIIGKAFKVKGLDPLDSPPADATVKRAREALLLHKRKGIVQLVGAAHAKSVKWGWWRGRGRLRCLIMRWLPLAQGGGHPELWPRKL